MSDEDVALAAAAAAEVADRVAVVALARARSRRPPRPPPPRRGGPWRCRGRARPRPRRPSRARPAASPARASARPSARASPRAGPPGASAVSRAARRCAALKSASGLLPSAEENWRSRSSRMRADCSRITSRSWCCTADVEPSPNSRCSSRARCPFSGAEDLVDLGAEELGHHARLVGEGGLDLARDLLELVADELGVHARPARAPAPARRSRSRRSTTPTGSSPASIRAVQERGGRRIVDDDVLDDHAPHQDVDAGWRSGVAASISDHPRYGAVPDGT